MEQSLKEHRKDFLAAAVQSRLLRVIKKIKNFISAIQDEIQICITLQHPKGEHGQPSFFGK